MDIDNIIRACNEGEIELSCGCIVELDGKCPCGNESPLIDLGMI